MSLSIFAKAPNPRDNRSNREPFASQIASEQGARAPCLDEKKPLGHNSLCRTEFRVSAA
jgi:hypothetical protein